MMLRIVATLFLVWTFGFGWFVATTPGPVGDVATDAVIVPTGAAGRIQRGLEVLDKGLMAVGYEQRQIDRVGMKKNVSRFG